MRARKLPEAQPLAASEMFINWKGKDSESNMGIQMEAETR